MNLFFFKYTAANEIYTLSLHDALPICTNGPLGPGTAPPPRPANDWPSVQLPTSTRSGGVSDEVGRWNRQAAADRKSTRLNSSHANISYAVFCLKKKRHILVPYFYTFGF